MRGSGADLHALFLQHHGGYLLSVPNSHAGLLALPEECHLHLPVVIPPLPAGPYTESIRDHFSVFCLDTAPA